MKKWISIISLSFLILTSRGFSQSILSDILTTTDEVFDATFQNFKTSVGYTLLPMGLSDQTIPMPVFSFFKKKPYSVFLGLSWNTYFPFTGGKFLKVTHNDNYESSLKNVWNTEGAFISYNLGTRIYIQDKRPVYRHFIYRLGYNFIMSDAGTNIVIKNPIFDALFQGDDKVTVAMNMHKVDAGVDFLLLENNLIKWYLGLGYTFTYTILKVDATIHETWGNIPNVNTVSNYIIQYSSMTHGMSIPLTLNFKVYRDIINAFVGFAINMRFADSGKIKMELLTKTTKPIALSRNYKREGDASYDILYSKIYTGLYFFNAGISLEIIPQPFVLSFGVHLFIGV